MARKTNNSIKKENLILCEGRDAEEFLIRYLESEALADEDYFANAFQVMDFGGNQNLLNYLGVLKNMEGFDKVKSLLIIRDAETNGDAAQQQIRVALKNADLPVPDLPCKWEENGIKVGFLLFPTCNKEIVEGTLEDLCLSILSEKNGDIILGEIDRFIEQLRKEHNRAFPHIFKSKLHTYFSVTDGYVSLKIGEAAKAGAFDWTNRKLLPLRNFMEKLFREVETE